MAFFDQQREDVSRAMVGQRKKRSTPPGATPGSTAARPAVAPYSTEANLVSQLTQLAQNRSAEEQLSAMRHTTEMERMRCAPPAAHTDSIPRFPRQSSHASLRASIWLVWRSRFTQVRAQS
jgi:hypothetical protein